jgi:hypothetical protein
MSWTDVFVAMDALAILPALSVVIFAGWHAIAAAVLTVRSGPRRKVLAP